MRFDQLIRVRYRVCFESGWISYSGFFAGLAIFLLCISSFGFDNVSQWGMMDVMLSLILPLLLLTAFGVLLCGFKLNSPFIYGIIGTLYCLYMVIRAFSYGGAGNILLAVIWYIVSGLVLLVTFSGVFPIRLLPGLLLFLPVVYRLVFIDFSLYFKAKDIIGFLPEASALSGLLAFSFFGMCVKGKPVKQNI
mgnify:CR=1 FL=1